MFRVTWVMYGDEIWVGDFSTYDLAVEACEYTKRLEYYENGIEFITFSIWYEGHLFDEITL